nr:DUF6318 family protein [Streptomyces sp. SID13031]
MASCSNKSPEAGRPNTAPPSTGSTSTTAGSSTQPSASTPTEPPARPKAAEGLTLAAAESFVYYYSELLNYASDTGDTGILITNSDSGCERCQLYADFVKKSNARNGLLTGDYHEHTKEVSELVRGSSGRLGGSSDVIVGAYVSKETTSATPITSKPTSYKREIALSPQGGNWVMYEMKFVEK